MKETNIKKSIILFSNDNNEPSWVLEYRLKCYKKIDDYNHPSFGPEIKLDIDFNNHLENKALPFCIEKDGFVACDIHTAFLKYPKLVEDYFDKLISSEENRYTILNSTLFESGYFIYVPKKQKVLWPIINKNVNCAFTKNIIVVDEGAELSILDYSTVENKIKCDMTEIFVEKNAKCKYLNLNLDSLSSNVIAMKRAVVSEKGKIDWINIIKGGIIFMGYPSTILKGDNSSATALNFVHSYNNSSINTGCKFIHKGKNTISTLKNFADVKDGSEIEYRNSINIEKYAYNSNSTIEYTYLFDGKTAKVDTVPKYNIANDSSQISITSQSKENFSIDVINLIENNFELSLEIKEFIQKLINKDK